MRFLLLGIVVSLLSAVPAFAGEPSASEATHLAKLLRGLMADNLPDPITKTDRNWGQQKNVWVGVKWRRTGPVRMKAEPQHALRNDGHWQTARIEAINPAHTLDLGINNLEYPTPGTVTFDAYVGLDVRLTYEQQLWKAGKRLYGGETRAKCRAALVLKCEATNRLEFKPGATLPDAVFRMRVTKADLFYTGLVFEHTLGVGGDAAKLMGNAVHRFLNDVKPSVEKELLDKANKAIVKAADTREVRVELDKLLAGKPPTVTQAPKK